MKPSPQPNTPAYQVTALDNFDFYESSGVPTQCRDAEHALSVAKGILERSLAHEHGQQRTEKICGSCKPDDIAPPLHLGNVR
jgi:hypothetical protein